ncbi:diaminopimelate decarboxylase [Sulfuricella denitrificans skB26]|uniref:Diaminopimelate decarboxylase n=1 Tax=Sulfuricella denitrificans (strain DSM 22764 / NBRC 105220 / skB26) TaxID=1163617 RepID=S6AZU0_SULDS|nr:diaminopimelate decarboxylase [Sulfuricella denitrificans]BAN34022.1 diaminopimelate decarboxylase [Sulfuricella denitrificans skB26]
MKFFSRHDAELCVESVPLSRIAEEFGTPCYVYSHAALTAAYQSFDSAFSQREHLICYAVKANSSLAILNLFARLGAGFDIVSGGELARVLAAGGDAKKVVFSGVGKTADEMRQALEAGILCFNVESESELERLNKIAGEMGKRAPVSLRVNPDVDPKTHPYISTGLKGNKFGIAYTDAVRLYCKARDLPHLDVAGIDCHIGSQITEVTPFADALDKILLLIDALKNENIEIHHLDLGGGLGICYSDETPPPVTDYADTLLEKLADRNFKILLEPGRALVGNAGLLLTKVEYLKHGDTKNFALVDAAMNDLMRPALYDAYHAILPVMENTGVAQRYEIVGPVCESGDFLGHDRHLHLAEGDLLAVMSAGAYGMSMSSNYNTRPRVAEIIVQKNNTHLIREREKISQLFALERLLP